MTKSRLQKLLDDNSSSFKQIMRKQTEQHEARELRSVEVREAIQVVNANLMFRLQDDGARGDFNPYPSHELQVTEIMAEYKASRDIGNDLVKRIINISAALKVPNGLALAGDEKSAEFTYLTKFMEANQLNEGLCTELSKEAEKQGQILTELVWDPNGNIVKIFYMPWLDYKYQVRPIGLNNMIAPYEVTWDAVENSEVKAGSLVNEQLAFMAFNLQFSSNDKLQLIIEGSPTLGNILQRIDDVGYDLVDWRQTNKLYAHPTPSLQTTDPEEAEAIQNLIASTGWTTGSMMVSSGELKMVVPDNFFATLKEAIETNIKFISGATGLSVGWLGFPDLMSNRAVSDSLGEPLEIVAANDITSWKSFYSQMFDNVIRIRNANLPGSTQLRTGMIEPLLKPMSDRIWQQLIRLYLPAVESNAVSRETFWSMIPGFPVAEEKKRFAAEQAERDKVALNLQTKQSNARQSNPDRRSDGGQQSTGSQRFNNKQEG